jgi:hypothetical protein
MRMLRKSFIERKAFFNHGLKRKIIYPRISRITRIKNYKKIGTGCIVEFCLQFL